MTIDSSIVEKEKQTLYLRLHSRLFVIPDVICEVKLFALNCLKSKPLSHVSLHFERTEKSSFVLSRPTVAMISSDPSLTCYLHLDSKQDMQSKG